MTGKGFWRRPQAAKVVNECRAGGWREGGGKTAEANEKTLKSGQLWRRESSGSRRKDAKGRLGGAGGSQGPNKR